MKNGYRYYEETREKVREDADGNITSDTTRIVRSAIKSDEPDYIKLYTKMWCEFNQIPQKYRQLFFSLICRMSYANAKAPGGGQTVCTIGTIAQAIMDECGWKTKDALYRGLKTLCDCGAIKKLSRGEYQINPKYAGKGPWNYNPKVDQGGVKDLIATFDFANKSVNTQIVWVSNDDDMAAGLHDAEITATRQEIKAG